ncbi:MAG: sodium:solute symporter family protein [Planctomycetota bacterium]
MPASHFSWIDGLIVAVYLLLTVGVGVYVNRFIHDMGDFVVAGRTLRTRLGIATMVGSELGLITAMYSAQKGFTGGFAAFHIGLAAGITTLVVGITGFIVVPLREAEVKTIPEYYELRFRSRNLRIFGGLILALSGILNMGLFLKAGAEFVAGLTGVHDPMVLNWIMTGMIVMVLIYTAMGGMVSVIITDFLQFAVLSLGLLLACVLVLVKVGWGNLVDTVEQVHGAGGFDPFGEGAFGTDYVLWMVFLGLISCSVWQTAVMRACAAENTQVVRKLYQLSSLGFMIRSVLPQFLGIGALAWAAADPTLRAYFFTPEGAIVGENSMRAMPVFLSQILPVGVLGLLGAGMLAAFMSTHDTYLLCWATVLVEDVIAPLKGGRLSQKARLGITRLLLVAIAGFLLVWSMWYPLKQDLWDYMAVSGAIYFTGAFAVLLAGLYWRKASRTGAWLALLSGTTAVLGLKEVQGFLGLESFLQARAISNESLSLMTVALSIILMFAGSLLFPDRSQTSQKETLA